MPTASIQSALQEAGFYATRKIKLKNKYKQNSAYREPVCVCRGILIVHFFFNKALDSMNLSDQTQSCCTRPPFVGRSAKKLNLIRILYSELYAHDFQI